MVEISLDKEYFLLSDNNQWIIAKLRKVKGKDAFERISFHSTISGAIKSYFERKTRGSNATDIKSLMKYQKALTTALNRVLHPLEIRVVGEKMGVDE